MLNLRVCIVLTKMGRLVAGINSYFLFSSDRLYHLSDENKKVYIIRSLLLNLLTNFRNSLEGIIPTDNFSLKRSRDEELGNYAFLKTNTN